MRHTIENHPVSSLAIMFLYVNFTTLLIFFLSFNADVRLVSKTS